MPELPEVQTVVDTLREPLTGAAIRHVHLARTDIVHPPGTDLCANLADRKFSSIGRRGKRIVFELDNGGRFYIHLGMSGRLVLSQATDDELKHTHLKIDVGDGRQLRFRDPRRFGGIWWLGVAAATDAMGPEPFGLRASQLARSLGKTRRAIKSALLDQRLVAGLGNIYVDEALHRAGIHPLTRGCDLSLTQVSKLNAAIKATLLRAIRHRGSTLRDYVDANGQKGDFQKLHRVYARQGQPCSKCDHPISKIVLGGRSTHFCSSCQS